MIQNVEDYRKKMQDILDDNKKFKKLDANETISRETKLQDYLRRLVKAKNDPKKT